MRLDSCVSDIFERSFAKIREPEWNWLEQIVKKKQQQHSNNLANCDERKIVYCEQCDRVGIKKSKSSRRHGKKLNETGEENAKIRAQKKNKLR